MDEQARDLAFLLRSILGMLPVVTSIGLHASEQWAFIMITVGSDEAVDALSEALGLRGDVWIDKRRWWRRATSESEQCLRHIVVACPPQRASHRVTMRSEFDRVTTVTA